MCANYLSTARDQRTTVAGLRLIERIMRSPLLREFSPVSPLPSDDGALLSRLRGFAGAVMHPVGSCRMGADDGSVVDPRLKVRGIRGLRVADASIMPQIVSANTNATAIMIGEKVSDLIKEDARCRDNDGGTRR